MRFLDFFRYILICVSLGLFFYQMNNSVTKLIEQLPVDSTSSISLTDLDVKPLVTVCNDELDTFLSNSVANNTMSFLSGTFSENITWKLGDLTYQDLVSKFDKAWPTMLVGNKSKPVKETNTGIMYPLGVCKSYEFEQTMTLYQIAINTSNFKVYITDPGMATFFSIDLMSHIGTQPKLKPWVKSSYDVRVRMEDRRKPGHEQLCDESPNYSFSDCVDEHIQMDLIKKVGCIPPFLSNKNTCNGTFNNQTVDNYLKLNFYTEYLMHLRNFESLKAFDYCKKYCKQIENTVHYIGEGRIGYGSEIHLRFNPNVEVAKKIVVYGPFEFIIDAGSSLGLWLGLSALGIWDLAVECFTRIHTKIDMKV